MYEPYYDTYAQIDAEDQNYNELSMSSGQQAQAPFMDGFANSQQPNMMMPALGQLQEFNQYGDAFDANPPMQQQQMKQGPFMSNLANSQQSRSMPLDQTQQRSRFANESAAYNQFSQQQSMPQLEQAHDSFINSIDVFTPINRRRHENPVSTHSKKGRFNQAPLELSQASSFVHFNGRDTLASTQSSHSSQTSMQPYHNFPGNFAPASAFRGNVSVSPSFPALHSTPLHQLPKFNNPVDQMKNPKIGRLKQAIQELDRFKIPESAQTRQLLFEELNKLEGNVNEDWLDFNVNWRVITIIKYIWLPIRRDIDIVDCLLGPSGSALNNFCGTNGCEIDILGAGSTKNPEREAQLLRSGDPHYQHYLLPLHLKILVKGAPLQAYERFWKILDLISRSMDTNASFGLNERRNSRYNELPKQHNRPTNDHFHSKPQRKKKTKIVSNANKIPVGDQKTDLSSTKASEVPSKAQKVPELASETQKQPDIITIDD